MAWINQTSEAGQGDLILNDMLQQIAHFPEVDRERMMDDIERLRDCLKNTEHALHENERLRQESERVCQEAVASSLSWREHFEILANSSPLLIWITDPQGGNLYINQTYREFIGVSLEEVQGLNWQKYLHPDDAPDYTEGFQQAVHEQIDFRGEVRIRQADGAWRWITTYAKPRFSADGTFLGHVGNCMDITNRKQAEEELRQALQRATWLARFPDENPNPVARVSSDGRVLYHNRASAELPGWSFAVGKLLPSPLQNILEQAYPLGRIAEQDVQMGDRYYSITIMPFPEDQYANLYGLDITERKLAQAEAEDGMRILDALMEYVPEGITIADAPSGRIRMVSQYGQELLGGSSTGMTSEEIAARWTLNQTDGVTPIKDEDIPLVRAIQKGETVRNVEIVRENTQGRKLTLLVSAAPIRSKEGVISGGIVAWNDITERKRVNELLRESEEKFSILFMKAAFAAALSRLPDGVLVDVNEVWEKVYGYPREEALGKNTLELNINPDQETRARILAQLQEGHSVRDLEMVLCTKSGDSRTVSVNIDIVDIGGVKYILNTSQDITERKQAEEALRISKEREHERADELEALMDAVPAMIWISHDPECRDMIDNRYGYEFLHMAPGDNISKSAPEAVTANQHYQNMKNGRLIPESELPMQIAAATGKPARDYMFDLVFDDGRTYNLLGNVNPLLSRDGKPSGAIGSFVDITELRRLERQQLELRTQMEVHHRLMEQREKDRQAIARDIHDGPVQTLSSTLFNIHFAREAFSDPQLRTELEQIALNVKNAVQELRQVIYELRPPSVIRFGLARAIHFHAEDLRDKNPEMQIVLHLIDDKNRLSEMECLTLYRIYQEAMINVVRHSGATKAWVRLSLRANQLTLEIHDNGTGLPPEHNTEGLIESGHYGLAGIRERVEALNGKLNLSSAPGEGTKVQVKISLSNEK